MKRPTNIALLIVAALAAVTIQRALMAPASVNAAPATEHAPAPGALEGKVLSVDPPGDGEPHSLGRKARVKLRSGEIVRASVGGCIIFPGQTTRLAKYGSGSSVFYVVTENGRNDG